MINFIKYFSFYTVLLLSINCNSDDNTDTDTEKKEDEFLNVDLSNDFLFFEKWYLNEVTSDVAYSFNSSSESSTDIYSQLDDCELDNFYIFEKENIVSLNDADLECESFNINYGSAMYDYSIDSDNKLLFIDSSLGISLGGFNNTGVFSDIEFLISSNSSFKLIKTTIKHNGIDHSYILRSDSNNRP